MAQKLTQEPAVLLPCRISHSPSISRIIELAPTDRRISTPRARVMLARCPDTTPSHQSRRTACRYLLQQILSSIEPNAANRWMLHHSTAGAPRVSNEEIASSLNVSMSHSGEWLAAGVALGAGIGVDVERLGPRKNMSAVAEFLGWRDEVSDIRDFHAKWTLWEASAKCVEGTVFMTQNPGFDQLYAADTQDRVGVSKGWFGLNGSLEEGPCYAIVLQCRAETSLSHRILEQGALQPW